MNLRALQKTLLFPQKPSTIKMQILATQNGCQGFREEKKDSELCKTQQFNILLIQFSVITSRLWKEIWFPAWLHAPWASAGPITLWYLMKESQQWTGKACTFIISDIISYITADVIHHCGEQSGTAELQTPPCALWTTLSDYQSKVFLFCCTLFLHISFI